MIAALAGYGISNLRDRSNDPESVLTTTDEAAFAGQKSSLAAPDAEASADVDTSGNL